MLRFLHSTFLLTVLLVGNCFGADVLLNEFNAVGSGGPIPDLDTVFDAIDGNGGNWFELLVVNDVDMRGWKLNWTEDEETAAGDPVSMGTITLSSDPLWSTIQRGTIISFIETGDGDGSGFNTSTNRSYNPAGGDWTINVSTIEEQAKPNGLATATTNDGAAGEFSVGNDDWTLTILNSSDELVFGPAGEGIRDEAGAKIWPGGGISSSEAGSLEGPGRGATLECWQSITNVSSYYDDTKSSSFGEPNVDYIIETDEIRTMQDLSALRGGVPEGLGDFDNSNVFDLEDILALQKRIELGTHEVCFDITSDALVDFADLEELVVNRVGVPMGDANLDGKADSADFDIWFESRFTTNTDWTTADFNGDGFTDVKDFNLWNANRTDAGAAAVPEPTGAYLFLLAAAGLMRKRRDFSA